MALGLDYYSLKKRAEGAAAPPQASGPAFIELTPPVLVAKQCRLELDNGSGATIRVQLVGYDVAEVTLLRPNRPTTRRTDPGTGRVETGHGPSRALLPCTSLALRLARIVPEDRAALLVYLVDVFVKLAGHQKGSKLRTHILARLTAMRAEQKTDHHRRCTGVAS
jgi:hypothetical protein